MRQPAAVHNRHGRGARRPGPGKRRVGSLPLLLRRHGAGRMAAARQGGHYRRGTMTVNWPVTLVMLYGLIGLPVTVNRLWWMAEGYYWRRYWRRASQRRH